MLYREAKDLLDKCCLEKTGKNASTGSRQSQPRGISQSSKLDWWVEGRNTKATTERTLAYLKAYKKIANSSLIPSKGIKLQDGYMWIDKGVMRFAIAKGLVKFDESKSVFNIL